MLSTNLAVKDVDKSFEFYTEVLGFNETPMKVPAPNGKLAYTTVNWRDANIGLGSAARLPQEIQNSLGHGVEIYILASAEDDLDAYYTMLKQKGVKITQEPTDQFYGDRTFSVSDLDGYRITFAKTVKKVTPAEIAAALKKQNGG